MNRTKTIQCIGVATVLVVGGLATTAAFAQWPPGHRGRDYDDDDGHHDNSRHHRDYDDDDNHRRRRDYDDDDNHSRYGDDDDNHHDRDDDDDGRWGHSFSDMSVDDVTFNDLGSHLQAIATVVGADGEATVELTLQATAEVRSSCAQPGTITRANERLDVETEGAGSIERAAVDGVRTIEIQTGDTSAVARELIECPSQRGASIDQVRFLDARIDLVQGTDKLTLLCTFDVSTDDGQVAPENFDCTVL